MKLIVTRSFEHRGTMWRSGQEIELTEAEAKSDFFAARTRVPKDGEETPPGGAAPNLTNGTPRGKEETPGSLAKGDGGKMTAAEIKEALKKAGVPVPPNVTKAELTAMWANFAEAVAGSADAPNGPEKTGL